MRLLVYGGRKYQNRERLYASLNRLAAEAKEHDDDLIIIQGDAKGADLLAKSWAIETGHQHEDYPAAWRDLDARPVRIATLNGYSFNKLAGANRNQKMIDVGLPDMALECPGEKGTADMRRRLRKAKIPIMRIS